MVWTFRTCQGMRSLQERTEQYKLDATTPGRHTKAEEAVLTVLMKTYMANET